jgi:hypothetical protein
VSQGQKDKGHMFSLIHGRDPNTNISVIMYTYKHTLNMFPKVGPLEDTEEKKKRMTE